MVFEQIPVGGDRNFAYLIGDVTTKQAAALCGIGERTLWRWSRSGIAPRPVTINSSTVRYVRDDYLAWIADGCPRCDGRAG